MVHPDQVDQVVLQELAVAQAHQDLQEVVDHLAQME
jgi:hypothetical protein